MEPKLHDALVFAGLFNLLLQASKQCRTEELLDGNTQSITKLLDGRNGCAVITPTDNVVYGRLRHTTNAAQFVNGNIAFLAQLDNSLPNGFADGHEYHPFLHNKMIPVCT